MKNIDVEQYHDFTNLSPDKLISKLKEMFPPLDVRLPSPVLPPAAPPASPPPIAPAPFRSVLRSRLARSREQRLEEDRRMAERQANNDDYDPFVDFGSDDDEEERPLHIHPAAAQRPEDNELVILPMPRRPRRRDDSPHTEHCDHPKHTTNPKAPKAALIRHLLSDSGHIRGLLFADDLVTFSDSFEDVKRTTQHVHTWCRRNNMRLNPEKCGYMIIKNSNAIPEEHKKLEFPDGNEIEFITESYKYLGLEIQPSLATTIMKNNRFKAGRTALKMMTPALFKRSIPIPIKQWIINSVIHSATLYGCEIWARTESDLNQIKLISSLAYKTAFRLRKNVSVSALPFLCNNRPVMASLFKRCLFSFHRWTTSPYLIRNLCRYDCDKLPSKKCFFMGMFNFIREHYQEATKPMGIPRFIDPHSDIESILCATNSYYIVNSLNSSHFSKLIKLKHLPTRFIPYISISNTSYFRIMTELIRIASGTWTSAQYLASFGVIDPIYLNKCPHCNEDTPEDISHFVFDCSFFQPFRSNYFSQLPIRNATKGCDKILILLRGDYIMASKPSLSFLNAQNFSNPKVLKFKSNEIERLKHLVSFLKEASSVRYAKIAQLSS